MKRVTGKIEHPDVLTGRVPVSGNPRVCHHVFPDGTRCTLGEDAHALPGMEYHDREPRDS